MNKRPGDYLILNEINREVFVITSIVEGGFGKIYFTLPVTYGICTIPLALKTIKHIDNLELFKREALLWSKIAKHPNIAEYVAFGKIEGEYYIASRRYKKTLSDIKYRDISANILRDYIVGLCKGLHYANEQVGLIHKDIKPTNIFLDGKEIKIGDFGLADYTKNRYIYSFSKGEIQQDLVISVGEIGGTLPFMAPELFLSPDPVFNIRTDIYAIGITFFSLITDGGFPYESTTIKVNKTTMKLFIKNTAKLNSLKIQKIILRCIDPDEKARYQSYEDLLNDLDIEEDDYSKLITADHEIASIINRIQSIRRMKKYQEALDELKIELKRYNGHPLLINQLAVILIETGKKEKAKDLLSTQFNTYESVGLEKIDAGMNLCLLYFEDGEIFNFIWVYEKCKNAIEDVRPTFTKMFFEIGLYELYLKRYKQALDSLYIYTCNNPNNYIAALGLIYAALHEKEERKIVRVMQGLTITNENLQGILNGIEEGNISKEEVMAELDVFFYKEKKNVVLKNFYEKRIEELDLQRGTKLIFLVLFCNYIFEEIVEKYIVLKPYTNIGLAEFTLALAPYLHQLTAPDFEMTQYSKSTGLIIMFAFSMVVSTADGTGKLNASIKALEEQSRLKKYQGNELYEQLYKSLKIEGSENDKETNIRRIVESIFKGLVNKAISNTQLRVNSGKDKLSGLCYFPLGDNDFFENIKPILE